MKKLSEQLAEMSVRAKNTEETVAAAEKEAQDKIAVRREEARLEATTAVEKVSQGLKSARAGIAWDLDALKSKIAGDMMALKARAGEAKHKLDVKLAETRADDLEWEAAFAINYAIASIEQAALATLDAIEARMAANKAGA